VRDDVVALYVDPRGPYPRLVREWYDEARDARTYAGPWPVVCHPPCGPWGTLRSLSRETTRGLAPLAIDQVRRFGGVLEHPISSRLFDACDCPREGEFPDRWGGWTIVVDQCAWGHVARKRSRLYVVSGRALWLDLPAWRQPTHWCSGGGNGRGKTPPGIKVCSAQQRRRTPPAFAEWLVSLAAQARNHPAPAADRPA